MSIDTLPASGDRVNRNTRRDGWRLAPVSELPVSVQKIEEAYRNLRADWMNLRSRVRQAEAELLDAKRRDMKFWAADVGERLQKLNSTSGQLKRMARLVGARAYSELYVEVCQQLLPVDARIRINDIVQQMLGGQEVELINNAVGPGKTALAEEAAYLRQLDDIIKAWAPAPVTPNEGGKP